MAQREQILVEITADGKDVAVEFGKMARAVEGFQKAFTAAKSGADPNGLSAVAASSKKAAEALKQLNREGGKYGYVIKRMGELRDQYSQQLASIHTLTSASKKLQDVYDKEAGKLAKLQAQYDRLANTKQTAANSAKITADMTRVTAAIAAQQAKTQTAKKAMDSYQNKMKDVSKNLESASNAFMASNAMFSTQYNWLGPKGREQAIAYSDAISKVQERLTALNAVNRAGKSPQQLAKLNADMNALSSKLPPLIAKLNKLFTDRGRTGGAANTQALFGMAVDISKQRTNLELMQKQKAEMDDIAAQVLKQRNYYEAQEKFLSNVNKLRSQTKIQMESEIALAKRLISLESQINQAIDKEVTLKRIAAEASKRQQDVLVRRGADTLVMSQATAWQKLGVVMSGVGQIWTRHNLMIGSVGKALIKNSAAATVTTGKYVNLGNILGVIAVRTGGLINMLRKGVTVLGAFAIAAGQRVTAGIGAMLRIMNNAVGVAGRFARATANVTAGIARSTAGFIKARFATANYRKETGDTVDAEGWHSRSLKGLVGNAVNMNRWINTLGSSIRQLGQAFQNAGTTMSIFLSYPVTATLKGWWTSTVAFDKSLIEIRKNADIALDGFGYTLQNVKKELLDLASNSPVPFEDWGVMAADAARLGIPVEFISKFTEVMAQFVTATNVSAADATDNMGRILAIFGDGITDAKEFMKMVNGIGSAINELGQANPITESDLIAAFLRVAPAAKMIDMSAADALGIAASVASGSASPERAGTQFAAALGKVAENIKKIAAASGTELDLLTEYASTDPAETFIAIANAISKIENPIARANATAELFGAIGGKAVGIVAAGANKAVDNVALANKAYEDGTSLAMEYSRALDAVSNQMAMLRNQIGAIGMALADAFLPVVTEILSYAVPAIRAFAAWMKTLNDKTKLMIVGFLMATAVIGPLLYAFGSLMFSIGIMITGLTGLATILGKLIGLPLALAANLLSLLSPFGLIRAAIWAAVAALVFFGDSFGTIGVAIHNVATKLYEWGFNAFNSFAEGILSSGSVVMNAVVSILDGMAMMLRAFSPPRYGPLRDIDQWGANIAKTFADAFANGDISGVFTYTQYITDAFRNLIGDLTTTSYDLISVIEPIVGSIVSTLGAAFGSSAEVIDRNMRGALIGVVNLVTSIQEGATNVGTLIDELGLYIGNFASDIGNLISQQLEYNAAVAETKRIQEELDGLDEKTNRKIQDIAGRKDLSISQRISLINQAKLEASIRRDQLEEEKKASEQREQMLQDQIGATKSLIELLLKLTPAMPKEGDTGTAIGGVTTNLDEVMNNLQMAQDALSGKFANMTGDLGRFTQKMTEATEKIKGFVDALRGADAEGGASEGYMAGFAYGQGVRDKYLQWLKDVSAEWEKWVGRDNPFATAFKMIQDGTSNTSVFDPSKYSKEIGILGPYAKTLYDLGQSLSIVGTSLDTLLKTAAWMFISAAGGDPTKDTIWTLLIREMDQFIANFQAAFGANSALSMDANALSAPLASISELLFAIAGYTFDHISDLGGFFGTIAGFGLQIWGVAGAMAAIALSLLKISETDALVGFIGSLNLIKDGSLKQALTDAMSFGDPTAPIGQKLVDYIVFTIQNANWSDIGRALAEKINGLLFGYTELTDFGYGPVVPTQVPGMVDYLQLDKWSEVISPILDTLSGFLTGIDWATIGISFATIVSELGTAVKDTDLKPLAKEFFTAFATTLSTIDYDSVIGAVTSFIGAVVFGLNEGIKRTDLDVALFNFVGAFVEGIANVPWGDIVSGAGLFVTKFLGALATAPWSNLADALKELLGALLRELAKPTLWSSLGEAIGSIVGAIAKGITGAPWGDLFNATTMISIADAFLKGFFDALQLAWGKQAAAVANNSSFIPGDPNNPLPPGSTPSSDGSGYFIPGMGAGVGLFAGMFWEQFWGGIKSELEKSDGIKTLQEQIMSIFYSPAKASDGSSLDLVGAQDNGIKIGNAVIGGVKDALSKVTGDIAQPIFDAITKYVTDNGDTYYAVFSGSLLGWALRNTVAIGETGKSIAGSVYGAISTFFDNNLQYFNSIVSAMFNWVAQNLRTLGNIGFSIGTIIATGIATGIVGGSAAIQQAIEGASGVGASSLPTSRRAFAGSTPATAQTINVYVQGNWTVDKRERIDEIADAVSRKLARDMKMTRGIK